MMERSTIFPRRCRLGIYILNDVIQVFSLKSLAKNISVSIELPF